MQVSARVAKTGPCSVRSAPVIPQRLTLEHVNRAAIRAMTAVRAVLLAKVAINGTRVEVAPVPVLDQVLFPESRCRLPPVRSPQWVPPRMLPPRRLLTPSRVDLSVG